MNKFSLFFSTIATFLSVFCVQNHHFYGDGRKLILENDKFLQIILNNNQLLFTLEI